MCEILDPPLFCDYPPEHFSEVSLNFKIKNKLTSVGSIWLLFSFSATELNTCEQCLPLYTRIYFVLSTNKSVVSFKICKLMGFNKTCFLTENFQEVRMCSSR